MHKILGDGGWKEGRGGRQLNREGQGVEGGQGVTTGTGQGGRGFHHGRIFSRKPRSSCMECMRPASHITDYGGFSLLPPLSFYCSFNSPNILQLWGQVLFPAFVDNYTEDKNYPKSSKSITRGLRRFGIVPMKGFSVWLP